MLRSEAVRLHRPELIPDLALTAACGVRGPDGLDERPALRPEAREANRGRLSD